MFRIIAMESLKDIVFSHKCRLVGETVSISQEIVKMPYFILSPIYSLDDNELMIILKQKTKTQSQLRF